MSPLPLAVTMGDPAGIGPELIGRAWQSSDALPAFFVIAAPDLLADRFAQIGLSVPIHILRDRDGLQDDALNVLPLKSDVSGCVAGTPDPRFSGAVIESIEMAVQLTHQGRAGAVVTCPIAKDVLYASGFGFPGHTEYLATLADQIWGGSHQSVMMLASEDFRVVPVTIHIALSAVPAALSTDLIVDTARIVHQDLKAKFGIEAPRLAIAGLNPHAGENGAMGSEDRDIVAPAVAALQADGIDARGPLPADTMFHERARATYDCALCMYHDQALIPIKTVAFDDGVNVTLGLPFIRTSPDHGTAFDIAGKDIARPDSLIAAIKMAGDIASRT